MQLEFRPPYQRGHSVVDALVTSLQYAAHGHLLPNSQHLLQHGTLGHITENVIIALLCLCTTSTSD